MKIIYSIAIGIISVSLLYMTWIFVVWIWWLPVIITGSAVIYYSAAFYSLGKLIDKFLEAE